MGGAIRLRLGLCLRSTLLLSYAALQRLVGTEGPPAIPASSSPIPQTTRSERVAHTHSAGLLVRGAL